MTYVDTGNSAPGIAGLFGAFPETGQPMRTLAQALLRGESSLSHGERELVATYVSDGNDCEFCRLTHGAVASRLLGDADAVDEILRGSGQPEVDARMEALLSIAESVRACDDDPSPGQIEAAREAGADDRAIHDTASWRRPSPCSTATWTGSTPAPRTPRPPTSPSPSVSPPTATPPGRRPRG